MSENATTATAATAGTGSCCGSCSTAAPAAEAAPISEVYLVSGMTCGHCVASVTEEVGALDGVRSVDVELSSGRVTVGSDRPLEFAAVAAAVTEAGYELTGKAE
ncbi:heavy-metal-associated domain-containing protein [Allostreptomyces psammosilenae]|uniref:Copper ion binding protein n=1 Tax=Allostreptomyces psammosilenae TaxID=1892865 RepID=A0A852ZR06_9ACTN|nr:cation transporter [Allostreptomyces psammosilenae]NYI03927.1 copper ion binding protein [Allostreptomyces psammosilenae]